MLALLIKLLVADNSLILSNAHGSLLNSSCYALDSTSPYAIATFMRSCIGAVAPDTALHEHVHWLNSTEQHSRQ